MSTMIICADIRTLIVAGLVLFLVKSGWNFPLPLHRKIYTPEKQLIMTRNPCQDSIGNEGVCMFKYDCIRQKGLTLSTCVDGFLFGACCSLNKSSLVKVASIPFSKENEFMFQKPNNIIISDTDEFVVNADALDLSNYSNAETKIFNFTVPSTFSDLDVNISTYTSSNGFHEGFISETTTIGLAENTYAIRSVSNSPVKVTEAEEKTETYLKNDSDEKPYNSLFNSTITPISYFISIKTEITDNTEVSDDKRLYISDNLTTSSYGADVFNSTELLIDVNYNWKQNEHLVPNNEMKSTEHSWPTSIEDTTAKETSTYQTVHTPEDLALKISGTNNTSQLIRNSSVLSAEFSEQHTTYILENLANAETTPFSKIENENVEFLTTSSNNSTDNLEQKAAVTNIYEFSNNQRSNVSTYFDNVSEIPSNTSEHKTLKSTTISLDNEKVTSKQISTNMKIPSESSFTIYGIPSTLYAIEEDEKSILSTTTKIDNIFNPSISTTDRDSRFTTQGLPSASQWPAQHSLPESFQSLVAQLTSEEMSSIATLKLNPNSHTLPPIDKTTLNESNLHTDQTLGLEELEAVKGSDNFYDFTEQHASNGNKLQSTSPTSISKETTPFVSEDLIEVIVNGDSYNKPTSYTHLYTTTFSSGEEFIQDIKVGSTVNSYEMNKDSHKTEDSSIAMYTETPEIFEITDFGALSKNSSHPNTNQLQDHGVIVATTDSFNLNVNNAYNLESSSTFEPSKDNNSLSNAVEFDNEWFEAVLYGKISKVPEIVNNHASKTTVSLNITNINYEINASFVNISKHPVENYSTLGAVNNIFESQNSKLDFPITTQTLSISTILANSHQTQEMNSLSSPNESNENTYPVSEDAYFIESNTSQTLPINQYTVNEILTVPTIHSTSLFEPSHELEENMNVEETMLNSSLIKNVTLVEDSPSNFHEHLPDLISISQINYTVFKDDVDYENISFTESFNENIVSNQSHVQNFAGNNNSATEINSDLNKHKENSTYSSNFSSLIDSVSTELIWQSILPNESIPLTTEVSFISNISENEEINPIFTNIPNADTNFTTTNNLPLAENPNTTYFGEVIENSTVSMDYATVKTNTIIINFITTVENSTLIESDTENEELTQKYNITTTSHNSNMLVETSTLSTMPQTKVPEIPSPMPTESIEQTIKWNYKKDCGVRLMQPIGRIVGGKNTYFGKWPWQALVKEATWLGLFVKNKCGGVLITAKYVLTAAHCQPGFFASLLVVLGTHDLSETFDNKASVIRNVKRMVVHRHYNAQTFENDLALLEMETPVEFSPYVVPICLPFRKEDFTGKMAFVTGWGKLTHGGDVPNILQEVQVPIVANGDCQRMFFHAGHQKSIRSNFVCAGYTNGGQDSCEGDSGGPLMVQREDNRWVLVGTVSHGIGCADPNLPGVYMRMSSYRPWIDSIINKHR